MQECILYWLFDDQCVCLQRHGYVGITHEWKKRMERHRRRFGDHIRIAVLFRGTKAECRKFEWQLRPRRFIGWNVNPGGMGGARGVKRSEAARQRIRDSLQNKPPMSEATKQKLRIASTGRTNNGRVGQKKSLEEIAKISASHKGKKLTVEHIQKIAATKIGNQYHLGHTHSHDTKERIRLKKIGIPVHTGEEKKKRSERWKGNTLTKGNPWSAARRLAWLQRQEE